MRYVLLRKNALYILRSLRCFFELMIFSQLKDNLVNAICNVLEAQVPLFSAAMGITLCRSTTSEDGHKSIYKEISFSFANESKREKETIIVADALVAENVLHIEHLIPVP